MLDSRPSASATTIPAVTACQAGDEHVDDGDDTADDGVEDGTDGVHDAHEARADGVEDACDLLLLVCCSFMEDEVDVRKRRRHPY